MKIASHHITIGNATDVGKVREHNEDYMIHFVTPLGYCILVCDGMGGNAAGEEASQNAAAAIKCFLQDEKNTAASIPTVLKNAIEFANFQLREMAQQNPLLKGMGTTCVLALIIKAEMYVAHAGDSRMYLIRGKNITQITKDHSTVQKLVDAGAMTEEEAEQSDKKNQITKAIGIFDKVEPTVTEKPVPLRKHDKILLCSDGLTGHVNRQAIAETINKNKDVQLAAIQLIEKANEGGGYDNITVQIIHYTGKSLRKGKKWLRKKYVVMLILLLLTIATGFVTYKKYFQSYKKSINPVNKDSSVTTRKESLHDSTKKAKKANEF